MSKLHIIRSISSIKTLEPIPVVLIKEVSLSRNGVEGFFNRLIVRAYLYIE